MQSDHQGYFAHSAKGSTWKKHLYTSKIGEGANAIYKYAKDKASDIADDAYWAGKEVQWAAEDAAKAAKNKAEDLAFDAEYYTKKGAKKVYNAVGGKERDEVTKAQKEYDRYKDSYNTFKEWNQEGIRNNTGAKKKQYQGFQNWDDRELRGRAQTVKGKKEVYNKTALGKAESALNKMKSRVAKAKKKLKHDGMDDYAATVEYGEAIIDAMFGRE